MLKITDTFRYHENGQLILTVISGQVSIVVGTPKTGFKAGNDGFNHSDLAVGALFNFFCWPPQKVIILNPEEEFVIDAFVAYRIKSAGTYKKEGDFCGEIKFSMS